MTLNDLI